MQLEFKDIYKIGINKIDEQHKALFDTFNDLDLAISRNEGNEVISEIIEFLLEYTKEHFETEEHYLDKYNYPDREAHKEIHREFVDRINQLHQNYLAGHLAINTKTQSFLFEWLTQHIIQTDKRYGMYLIDKIKGRL